VLNLICRLKVKSEAAPHSLVVINDKRIHLHDIADEYDAGSRYARTASVVS